MSKEITVCADDYGQNQFINEGILSLANKGRINAISCLTNMPSWQVSAEKLSDLCKTTFIGLHINLTDGKALSRQWKNQLGSQFPSLLSIIKYSYVRKLKVETVEAEIDAQLKAFTDKMGYLPDHFDGHQHVQQLPVIRQALLNLNQKYHLPIRNTVGHWSYLISTNAFPKHHIIALLGGLSFNHLLKKRNIPSNSSFSGIYNFAKAEQYHKFFPKFLKRSHSGGMIMCHPGLISNDTNDPLYQYRHHEWQYFNSEQYLKDLRHYQISLAKKQGSSTFISKGFINV